MRRLARHSTTVLFALILGISGARAAQPSSFPLPGSIADDNARLHQAYGDLEAHMPGMRSSLTPAEAGRLYSLMRNHPVAALTDENVGKYDPTGEIGYCFGRAMAVQLMARRMGLSENFIRKLFLIGDLREGTDPEWRFHVTTLIRVHRAGDNYEWVAVDPLLQGPMIAPAWLKKARSIWDKKNKAYAYVADADAVLPDVRHFPEVAAETSAGIIELSFRPEHKTGFTKAGPLFDARTYNVGPVTQDLQFLDMSTLPEPEAFDLARMEIDGVVYDYHGYFRDLLQDIRTRPDAAFQVTDHGETP
ncbi:MAG TPA: hypothetical protein VL588_08605 [Bdellovibrionota bacterium]|nr:hypothetical protein [Bdellovibrionota bacterium]